jgi:Pyruvate/2-oxoacid:ferredoxin oxidoreductase delta subunit
MAYELLEFGLIDELKRDFKSGVKFRPPNWKNESLVVNGEIRFNYNICNFYCNSGMVYNSNTDTKVTIVEFPAEEEL